MGTVGVNAPKSPVTKGSGGIAAATLPNICKMPGPPAPFVPTPLPNIGDSGDSPQGYSTSVTFDGQPIAIKGATFKSKGDIASQGTGGGIISAKTQGNTEFVAPGSMDVKVEGKNVHLLTDAMLNNCGSPANAATMPGVIQAPAVPALPVLEFDHNEFPEKTENMRNGMDGNDSTTLTRQTSKSAIGKNRRAALKGKAKGPPGTSLDEFPFASSTMGGAKASVVPIPVNEQNKQGGKCLHFTRSTKLGTETPSW